MVVIYIGAIQVACYGVSKAYFISTNKFDMLATVLDGRSLGQEWQQEFSKVVPKLSALLQRAPRLSVVLVGNRPDSLLYVQKKKEACQQIGIQMSVTQLQENVNCQEFSLKLKELSDDELVDGILVQFPLPPQLSEEAIMEVLDPMKDVDGFHPLNMGRNMLRGVAPRFLPCTPLGIMEMLKRSQVQIQDKTAVVIGDSNIVGTPLAMMLRDQRAAAVTICHSVSTHQWLKDLKFSEQQRRVFASTCLPRVPGPQFLKENVLIEDHIHDSDFIPGISRKADILIVALGVPEIVDQNWVKPGAVVVDVGINVIPLKDEALQNTSLEKKSKLLMD